MPWPVVPQTKHTDKQRPRQNARLNDEKRVNHYISKKDGLDKSSNAADAPTGRHAQRAGAARVHDRPAPARLRHQEHRPRAAGQHAQRAGSVRVNDRPAHARLRHQEHQPRRLLPRQRQGWPPRPHPDRGRGLHYDIARGGLRQHLARRRGRAERKDTHEEPNGARFGNISHAAEVSYGAVAHDVPLK